MIRVLVHREEIHLFRPLIAPRRNALLVSSLVHVGFLNIFTPFQSIHVSCILDNKTTYLNFDDYEESSLTWYDPMSTAVVGGQAP